MKIPLRVRIKAMGDQMDVDAGGSSGSGKGGSRRGGGDAGAGEDDDDPVVQELDVFLSQNLAGARDGAGRSDGLFLFQYPLRPRWRALDDGWKLDKVSYRPLNEMVELELLAGEEEEEFRHKLVSSKVAPKTSFAVGLLRGEQLHLTPLQSMLQFRPRFDWKDEEDAAQKQRSSAAAAGGKGPTGDDVPMDDVGSGSDAEQQPAPVVQVKVSKRESDKAKEIRRSSYAYLREQEDKEPWLSVALRGPHDQESKQVLEGLVSASSRDVSFSMSSGEYLACVDAKSRRHAVAPRAHAHTKTQKHKRTRENTCAHARTDTGVHSCTRMHKRRE